MKKLGDKHLHIVSFDVPLPANYGGVIDVFFKMKALASAGIKIHLHCFVYGRRPDEKLQELCHEVHYYPRNVSKSQLFTKYPYIVVSRADERLIENLLKDDYPILFEGLHTCYFLQDPRLDRSRAIVRTHNIEHEYYNSLARVERNIFKRYYYYNEALKLESFEEILGEIRMIAAISPNDASYFQSKYGNAFYLPAFHPYDEVKISDEVEPYAFYHGNLSIGENNEAALFLLEHIFQGTSYPLLIAGRKPSRELINMSLKMNNVTLISDLNSEQIRKHISEAQVNILPTFQPTGIKLKLLSALYSGKHCLVNEAMVDGTGLESLCDVAHDAEEMRTLLAELVNRKFNVGDIEKRKKILYDKFCKRDNAIKFLEQVYDQSPSFVQ